MPSFPRVSASRLGRSPTGALVVILGEPDLLGSTGAVVGTLIGNSFVSGETGLTWLGRKTGRTKLSGDEARWIRRDKPFESKPWSRPRQPPVELDAEAADRAAIEAWREQQPPAPTSSAPG